MESSSQTGHRANPLTTTRRLIWYALRTVLIICAVLALCYAVFTEFMYISNMYIVATEGMALRAEAVLKSGSLAELEQYFTEEQLKSDSLLYSGKYDGFTVESYDYRFQIKSIFVLPWSNVGNIVYVERIPQINGTPANEAEEGAETPEWTPVKYKLILTKVEGRWLISGLGVLEENVEEEALPTPDYSRLESAAPRP